MNTFYVYSGIIYCILESVLTLEKSICCKMWECCWRAKLVLLETFLSLFLFEQNLDENKIRFLFPQWGTCSDTAAKVPVYVGLSVKEIRALIRYVAFQKS